MGLFKPEVFRGKIVVVGATAQVLQDIHGTSVGQMSGPEVEANAIVTILAGFPLRTRHALDLALIVALALVMPLASLRLGPAGLEATAFMVGVLYLVAAQITFDDGVLVSVVYPLVGLVLSTVGIVIWHAWLRRPL
jgi:CHASE2 domain-containing sensor protein